METISGREVYDGVFGATWEQLESELTVEGFINAHTDVRAEDAGDNMLAVWVIGYEHQTDLIPATIKAAREWLYN